MRSPPNAFGTSLIDLLVGALCMVALLWVLQARNSGLTGEGEAERISAFVLFEQYGASHITGLKLGQGSTWSCDLAIDPETSAIGGACGTTEASTDLSVVPALPWANGQGGVIVISSLSGVPLEPPMEVKVRFNKPDSALIGGLNLNVDRLAGLRLDAGVTILPCCAPTQPHYLRTLTLSPSGASDRLMFWHEADTLLGLLKAKPSAEGWVDNIRKDIRSGTRSLALYSFSIPHSSSDDCVSKQAGNPGYLELFVTPEGDVRFLPPKTAEALAASGGPETSGHAELAANFSKLLNKYAEVAP